MPPTADLSRGRRTDRARVANRARKEPMKTITGNTYPVKEQLKALGGKWNRAAKGWDMPDDKVEQALKLVAEAKISNRQRRKCADCGEDSKGYYRCYSCSLDYREGGSMHAGGQSYWTADGTV